MERNAAARVLVRLSAAVQADLWRLMKGGSRRANSYHLRQVMYWHSTNGRVEEIVEDLSSYILAQPVTSDPTLVDCGPQ